MARQYNDPGNVFGDGVVASGIGSQIRLDHYQKAALIQAAKERYFGALADSTAMPKNMGKKIKRYLYVPLLDDANLTDQGLDTDGYALESDGGGDASVTLVVTKSDGSIPDIINLPGVTNVDNQVYFTHTQTYATSTAATVTAANLALCTLVNLWFEQATLAGGLGLTLVGGDELLKFTDGVNTSDGLAYALGFRFADIDGTLVDAAADLDADVMVTSAGNLYGSSKDVGTISGKMPALTESGGRVNRVGFTRVELEGTLEKYGFFEEYTQESVDFDSDADLMMHINREMIFGANEMTEDLLQIDLLNAAGVVYYPGAATSNNTLDGSTSIALATEVEYGDLARLSVQLDNNRTPKHTKIISGSRMIDTKTIRAGRVMYIGSELIQTCERMVDYFSNQAFIPVNQYADAGMILNGEIGSVGEFRLVVVPEMMHWSGSGASGTRGAADTANNPGFRATGGYYDVFPMLVVGSESFTTIGFQTSGKNVKFVIKHAKPGSDISFANDPYGETGFMSIKWYYGFMTLRAERIGLIKTLARV